MLAVTEKKMQIVRLFLCALVCTILYHFLAERQATVSMEVHSTAPTVFKMYWLKKQDSAWNEDHSRKIRLQPGDATYTFKLTDLDKIAVFRIDPSEEKAQVTIRSITIAQNGYAPIRIAGDEAFSRITLGGGIESVRISDGGLVVTPATNDPQLFFDLPASLRRTTVLWSGEFIPLTAVFLLAWFAGVAMVRAGGAGNGTTLIPVALAAVLGLIAVMATISSLGAHPDEMVHVRAGEYMQRHFLPPPVDAEEARNTYSVYGVSRLHSGEIAYFFLGRFTHAFHAVAAPTFMLQRSFNIVLWAILLLLALAYRDFSLLMLPALLSPQIWYMFSYVNSEGFAFFVMMLAAYQLVSPHSSLNTLLQGGPGTARRRWFGVFCLGVLLGVLLLLKKNFDFFLLYIGLYFLWRLLFGHTRLNRYNLRRIAVLLLLGLGLFGAVRGVDHYIHDFQKEERLLQARYKYAGELWNPGTPLEKRHVHLQMRDRGTTLKRLFYVDNWGRKVFQSAVGHYGFTSVSASGIYYSLMKYMGLLFLLSVSVTVLVRGRLEGISLWCLTLAVAAGLAWLALYHAWTVDFQPQGRYFLPVIGMLGIFFFHARHYLFRSLVPLVCLGLFCLSLYSFICVGLSGIPKAM